MKLIKAIKNYINKKMLIWFKKENKNFIAKMAGYKNYKDMQKMKGLINMTNLEIISKELVEKGLYTENELEMKYLENGQLPVATYQEWQKRGYQVKRGEKSIVIFIWKHKDKKIKKENTDEEEIIPEKFIKVKAFFFTEIQVQEKNK